MSKEFTVTQKIAELKREIAMRHRVYPNWVSSGRMKQEEADWQIGVLESIKSDYEKMSGTTGSLFGGDK